MISWVKMKSPRMTMQASCDACFGLKSRFLHQGTAVVRRKVVMAYGGGHKRVPDLTRNHLSHDTKKITYTRICAGRANIAEEYVLSTRGYRRRRPLELRLFLHRLSDLISCKKDEMQWYKKTMVPENNSKPRRILLYK